MNKLIGNYGCEDIKENRLVLVCPMHRRMTWLSGHLPVAIPPSKLPAFFKKVQYGNRHPLDGLHSIRRVTQNRMRDIEENFGPF
jgi:hypothetical protein